MILITAWEARKLLSGTGDVPFSPDLGISRETATVADNHVLFKDGTRLSFEALHGIANDESTIYFIRDNHLFKSVIRSRSAVYKLVPVKNGAPTLEINGIRMHRVKGTTPDRAVKLIFKFIHIKPGDRVLDICTGLGYTAQEAVRRGARVTTIEKNEEVLELSKINPWSRDFWKNVSIGKIKIVLGDAKEVVKEFEDSAFDVILHDPPTLSIAGELYSKSFYKELFRISNKNARLFHYTGNPGERFRRKSVTRGVIERLRETGWERVRRINEIQGIVARKLAKQPVKNEFL